MISTMLIAGNNAAETAALEKVFSYLEDITLLPAVHDGRAAVDTILHHKVDILLLDMFLQQLDGLCVIEQVDRLAEDRRPLIFVMTDISDDRFLHRVRDRIIYCFVKPLQYELVQLRVLELSRTVYASAGAKEAKIDLLDRQIAADVRAIGVPAHLKGYYYLRDAIRIYALSNRPTEISITNDIYPMVAKMYNTRPTLVEHAIRNAIEIAWTRGNLDTIYEYFGYTVNDYKGKPSNREFVAMMAERALNDLKRR